MAKRMTAGLAWRRLGNVRVAWLTWVLIVVLCPGNVLRAADSVPSSAPSSNAVVAALDYQESDYSVGNWGVSVTVQTAPFKKEPAAATGKIIRGVLNFGGASNSIPFLWQRDAGKLYLDLNGNRDLTDDPSGVFTAPAARPVSYQTFTNVHLFFNTASGRCPVLADISFYDFGLQPMCITAVRSFWQGKVTLQGRDWQAGIVQNGLNPSGSLENSRLLLRPWEKRNQPFNASDGCWPAFPFRGNFLWMATPINWNGLSVRRTAKPRPRSNSRNNPSRWAK